jgi:hypothetical protein
MLLQQHRHVLLKTSPCFFFESDERKTSWVKGPRFTLYPASEAGFGHMVKGE